MWSILVAIAFVIVVLAAIMWWLEHQLSESRRQLSEARKSIESRSAFGQDLVDVIDSILRISTSSMEELSVLMPELILSLTGTRANIVINDDDKVLFSVEEGIVHPCTIICGNAQIDLEDEPKEELGLAIFAILNTLSSRVFDIHNMTLDELTGLCRRKHFDRVLEAEISRSDRLGHSLSIAAFDLDFFKEVNDTHGHLVGDLALKHFAQILKSQHRPYDTVARIGGDEFAVLLPETNLDQAAHVAGNVRRALLGRPLRVPENGTLITLTLSAGVASSPQSNGEELFTLADKALYESKSAGRDRVTIAAPYKGETGA